MKQIQLWSPTNETKDNSNLKQFEKWLSLEKSLHFNDYNDIWRWSVDDYENFWTYVLEYFKVAYHGTFESVISNHSMPGVEWFKGIKLSYGEHLFRNKNKSKEALIFVNEEGTYRISWEKLEHEVNAIQNYLKSIGIKRGDVVGAYLPNIPETISCFIAVNSLGAVWTCCSPDFGESTVIERMSQCNPKLFISCDGYKYGGKSFDKQESISRIKNSINSIESNLMISYLGSPITLKDVDLWAPTLAEHFSNNKSVSFTKVPFNHPIWILYSSGTTGKPKAITHSHGGVLIEHLKYMTFQNDVKKEELFFWYSTTGWMMWNFLQSSMLVGAIPVLFDGSPAYPDMNRLWDMAEELGIQHFGTSAPFLTACMKESLNIKSSHNLESLRSIGSTGAPLPNETFEYIYKNIKSDLWLCSMSGGTDVCTAFVGSNPYDPVYKGYIQSRALGNALYAYNNEGEHVYDSLGEMVIENPLPSMPIYFWNDENHERYRSSYFEEYPGKWRHGDWINIHKNGSLIIHGRSDATLNRNGIRIGTAEIYGVLDKIEAIKDALIINIEKEDEDIMPLYVVLNDESRLDEVLKKVITKTLRTECSPRHVPSFIKAIPDIPYTLSGKKMEVPIKKILIGMTQTQDVNMDAIRNPEAMEFFIQNRLSLISYSKK